jgi:hypothetical protein
MTDIPDLTFVDEPAAPDNFNVLCYGPMGSGKSTGAATAPGPILWLNAQGAAAMRFPRKTAREHGTQILEVEIPKDRGADVAQILRNVIAYWRSDQQPRPATIVMDTVGDVRDRLAKQFVNPSAKDTRKQWGDVAKVLKEFVLFFRDEPVNLVLLAHESVEDSGDDRIIRPAIGGALTEGIPNEMDVVGYCGAVRDNDTGARRYEAVFVEVNGRRAKDRSNGLGTHRPIDLTEWLAAYRAALTPDVEPVPWDDADPGLPTAEELAEVDGQGTLETPTDRKASPSEARTILEAGQPLTSVQLLHLLHTVQGKAPHGLDEQAAVRRIGDEVRGLPGDRVQPLLRAIRAATTTGEIA